jgi:iron complex outermembrane receptor protein
MALATVATLAAVAMLATPRAAGGQTTTTAAASATATVLVRVTADSLPVPGAAVAAGASNAQSDESGLALLRVPAGRRTFRVTSVGFLPESLAVNIGAGINRVTIALHHRETSATEEKVAAQGKVAPPAPPAPQKSVPPDKVKVASPDKAPARDTDVARTQVVPPASVATATAAPASAATDAGAAPQRRVALPNGLLSDRRDLRTGVDEPTTIESTDRADIEAQIDRSPGTIADLVGRMDGVRVQPLVAGPGGSEIRIRGLPGHYAKILTDGLPLYSPTPQGLEPLEIPALDVQRVEVIPGIASALYGPTALSGIVNVVSAPPTSQSQALVNGTTREASDIALFQTGTINPDLRASLEAGRHFGNPADLDGDGWTEVPGYRKIIVRPRVYWSQSDQSSWFMTGGWTSENRRSGTFKNARLPDFNRFANDDDARHADVGTVGRIALDTTLFLTVRASLTRDWRTRWFGTDREHDRRNTIFGDVSLTKSIDAENVAVGGISFERDQFTTPDVRDFSYRYTTPSLYADYTLTPVRWIGVTAGGRLDLQSQFGDFASPRVSVVLRPSEAWTARITRSTGVYAPTPLTDETEAFGLSHFRATTLEAEHADGWSVDLDGQNGWFEVRGAAYRTVIAHPVIMRPVQGSLDEVQLVNADDPTRTQGIDASVRIRANPLRFTASYSYIDATRPEIGVIEGVDFSVDTTFRRVVPLNPRHSGGVEVALESQNNLLVGVEGRYTGRMALSDTLYSLSKQYVTLDARVEKHISRAILFVYGKNLTNVKQGQFNPVLLSASGAAGGWTRDAWAPLDGLVVNAGVRVKY